MSQKMMFKVQVPVTIFREGKVFIAYSPVLDLSTCAGSFSKVRERFTEVVQIFFEELVSKGTLNEVLTDLGWKKIASRWQAPLPITHDLAEIPVVVN